MGGDEAGGRAEGSGKVVTSIGNREIHHDRKKVKLWRNDGEMDGHRKQG